MNTEITNHYAALRALTLPPHIEALSTKTDGYHLAQVNIGKMKGEISDPIMEGFRVRLDEVNALADASPGFVWRYQGDGDGASYVHPYDDKLIIVNLSVWDSLGDLYRYVYASMHRDVLKMRTEWFDKISGAHSAMWWVPKGVIPSLEESMEKLNLVQRNGPTLEAFTFAKPFLPTVEQQIIR